MFKHSSALSVAVFLVSITITAWSQEPSSEGKASERLIAHIDASSWIAESLKASPDSRRVVYGARRSGQQFVVIDGHEGKPYDGIIGSPIFSPDSQALAYLARRGAQRFAVVDGREGQPYDHSVPGGRIIFDSPDRLHYLAAKGTDIYLVEERIK
jgi:hypothetical protein